MFNILGGSQGAPTKDSISQKAQGALGMFNAAINTLEESNVEAMKLVSDNQEVIDTLAEENKELHALNTSNQKIIDKIKALVS
mgnify:CR=1 FL=1|jgi:predicted small metal-binding protein